MTAEAPEPEQTPQEVPRETAEETLESGPQDTAGPAGPASADELDGAPAEDDAARLTREFAERTADLQRLQAEYVNYKRRVDRDRVVVREHATAGALTALLPVLDDIDRARQHDQLTGGFKAVAESLERIVAGLGLERFGEAGAEFDPRVHEALTHDYSADVSVTTAQTILQPGYRIGERIVRPARVAVVEPSGPAPDPSDEPAGGGGDEAGGDEGQG